MPAARDEHEFVGAGEAPERSFVSGLLATTWAFMAHNKVWWLTPLLVVFGLLGALLWSGWRPPVTPIIVFF